MLSLFHLLCVTSVLSLQISLVCVNNEVARQMQSKQVEYAQKYLKKAALGGILCSLGECSTTRAAQLVGAQIFTLDNAITRSSPLSMPRST